MSTIARIITLDLKMNSIIILTLFLQALIAYKCPSFQRGIAASSRPGVLELSSNTFFMLHLFPSNPAARSSLTPKFSRTFSFSSAKNYDNLFMSPLYNSLLGVNTDRRTVVYEMVLPRDLGFDIVQGPGVALVGNVGLFLFLNLFIKCLNNDETFSYNVRFLRIQKLKIMEFKAVIGLSQHQRLLVIKCGNMTP